MDKSNWVRPDIAAMAPYTPIVPFESLSARLGREPADIVKLDANENPYGPSPRALEALAGYPFYHVYPDPEANLLRDALSQFTGLDRERLMVGMGADELIDLVLRALIQPGDGVIDCPPTFGMYPFSTAVNAGRYLPAPRRDDFSLDLPAIEEMARQRRARILFLCSPNNPDGSLVDDESLHRLLRLPLLVVLDEAYVEFAAPAGVASRIHWVNEYDNLAVLRTFSKLAGLAGLRVGYGAFPEWLLPHLWKIKQPYNVNVAASQAALASLQDLDWLRRHVRLIVAERERLAAALAAIPYLQPFPSQANFILCRVIDRDAKQLKLDLERAGVLVRYFDKQGLKNCIRISVGRPEDTDRLVKELVGYCET